MMEEEQYGAWLQADRLYRGPLVAYEKNPIWTVDPKHTAYRDACKQLRPAGYAASSALRVRGAARRLHQRDLAPKPLGR